jgi:ATP-dependent RNA helicase DeaD
MRQQGPAPQRPQQQRPSAPMPQDQRPRQPQPPHQQPNRDQWNQPQRGLAPRPPEQRSQDRYEQRQPNERLQDQRRRDQDRDDRRPGSSAPRDQGSRQQDRSYQDRRDEPRRSAAPRDAFPAQRPQQGTPARSHPQQQQPQQYSQRPQAPMPQRPQAQQPSPQRSTQPSRQPHGPQQRPASPVQRDERFDRAPERRDDRHDNRRDDRRDTRGSDRFDDRRNDDRGFDDRRDQPRSSPRRDDQRSDRRQDDRENRDARDSRDARRSEAPRSSDRAPAPRPPTPAPQREPAQWQDEAELSDDQFDAQFAETRAIDEPDAELSGLDATGAEQPAADEPDADTGAESDDSGATDAAPTAKPVAGPPSADFNKKAHEEIFEKSIRFADLGLNEGVLKGVTDAGFEHPTSIQAKLIPTILSGRDVLGQAKTGTGKTASFALPMLSAIKKGEAFAGLCLVPTRELALQVAADFRELGRFTGLSVLPVYGGQNINTQAKLLERGPEIIVATPGRIMDMVQRGYLHYGNIKMVVLDEVDRMLDIGFRDDIKRILSSCPESRQTVFVSATLSPEIESLARSFAHDCEKIIASAGALTVAKVKQFYLAVEPWDKRALLRHLLTHESPALTVVFCRTKRTVDVLTESLQRHKIDAYAIHGDMHQGKRNSVIEKLRKGALGVLVASDLASRGLDVEGITHVINYDLPEDPDLYVHRIGRTARAGRDGVAWSLVTPEQGELLTQIELLINAEIPKLDYPDFVPGPIPRDVVASKQLDAKRRETAKTFNRFAASTPGAIGHIASSNPAEADPTKFPGGVIPTKLPPKLMRGKVKTARSMKAAIAQTLKPGATTTPAPGPHPSPQGGDSATES